MNIRARLTVQFILLTAGIFLTALVFIHRQFETHVENEFFTLLESKARMTATMILRHENELQPLAPTVGTSSALPSTGNTLIFDDQMRCVFALNPAATNFTDKKNLALIREKGCLRFSHDQFSAFGAAMQSASGRPYVVVSEDLPDRSKLEKLRNILLLAFFLVMAAIAAGGWFYAGQALRPVSKIVDEVDEFLPTDLSRRLRAENQHDELSHLVKTFNRLLDRIEHAFQMQRGFISNVSHELKNPLAAMDAQLQLARSKNRSTVEYETVLASLHDDVHDLADTSDKLLQLAKVHSDAAGITFSTTRLDELLYQTRAALLKTHPNYVVRIQISDLPENENQLSVRGNEPLLRTALLNLFDNGCKFSPNHLVEVAIGFNADGQPRIEIKNEGAAIPAADLPRIFEPFFRSAQTMKQKGSGIGLSLVHSILKLHDVELHVESGADGTRFLLKFKTIEQPEIERTPVAAAEPIKNRPSVERPSIPSFSFAKRAFQSFFMLGLLVFSGIRCSIDPLDESPEMRQAAAVSWKWNQLLLEAVRHSEGYRPPVSARMFAYMGLAAWETAQPALPDGRSLETRFSGLQLPNWANFHGKMALPVALAASYKTMTRRFFPHAPPAISEQTDELFASEMRLAATQFDEKSIEASEKFGEAVAEAVFNWSTTDAIGHQAFLFNYDKNYAPPVGDGKWHASPAHSMPALLPNWGRARTFLVATDSVQARPPKPFSEERGSGFFAEAMEVYTLSKPISPENQWIAEFWSDDSPGVTFCAASRWISIANQSLQKKNADFKTVIETYLKIGFALNDAAVNVWKIKYTFNLERPESYVSRNIAAGWEGLHAAPPFPAYPSGHATFGGAACTILSHLFGEKIQLTDRSHEGRKEFLGTPRSFETFSEMARENAISRLFIGVHYRMDCEEGLRIGTLIGEKIAHLKLWNDGRLVENR